MAKAKARDEFPDPVKRALYERVNGLCSKPDCRVITKGAKSDTDQAFTIGQASHIHAASKGGPRFLSTQTPAQRKAFANGIWLCSNHGTEVDADEITFPADMLRTWKSKTEGYVRSMVGKMPSYVPPPPRSEEGLIALGPNVLVFGRIVGHSAKSWKLSLGEFLLGDVHDLYQFVDTFESATPDDRYVSFERTGAGGMLAQPPSIVDEGELVVSLELESTLSPANALATFDVTKYGKTLAIDMALDEPHVVWDRSVSGADTVPQRLFVILTGVKGGWRGGDDPGSRVAELNLKLSGDHIENIIAIEIARLASVPYHDRLLKTSEPALGFVRRVRGVRMMAQRSPLYLMARLSLDIWGLAETQEYDIPISSSTESLGPEPKVDVSLFGP